MELRGDHRDEMNIGWLNKSLANGHQDELNPINQLGPMVVQKTTQ
jgi:hypothetical protein